MTPKFDYHCTKCSRRCTSNSQTAKDGTRGLGTWRCPSHGKVAVTRKPHGGESGA